MEPWEEWKRGDTPKVWSVPVSSLVEIVYLVRKLWRTFWVKLFNS